MTIKAFSIAFCMLVLAAPGVPAQSGPAASDPITPERGPGSSAPDGGDPIPVTFELKFDGKGEVSGTFTGLPAPGDVKTGTFDPKTGALRLELTKQGESVIRLMLEGTVSNGRRHWPDYGYGHAGNAFSSESARSSTDLSPPLSSVTPHNNSSERGFKAVVRIVFRLQPLRDREDMRAGDGTSVISFSERLLWRWRRRSDVTGRS